MSEFCLGRSRKMKWNRICSRTYPPFLLLAAFVDKSFLCPYVVYIQFIDIDSSIWSCSFLKIFIDQWRYEKIIITFLWLVNLNVNKHYWSMKVMAWIFLYKLTVSFFSQLNIVGQRRCFQFKCYFCMLTYR